MYIVLVILEFLCKGPTQYFYLNGRCLGLFRIKTCDFLKISFMTHRLMVIPVRFTQRYSLNFIYFSILFYIQNTLDVTKLHKHSDTKILQLRINFTILYITIFYIDISPYIVVYSFFIIFLI